MTTPIAWVLNLDAELELLAPDQPRSARMQATIARHAAWLVPRIRAATGCDVVVLDPCAPVRVPAGTPGDAWCPTPAACALLARAGATPPVAPSPDVLVSVNHRAFAATLGIALPGAAFVTTVDACDAVLATAPAQRWLLKRPLGFSGRMRKVVVPAARDAAATTWIAASMTDYGRGLQVEPLVERVLDVSLHGAVAPDGTAVFGDPVAAAHDADGAFVDARVAAPGELTDDERSALTATAARVAQALHAAGYFGPFGIDAFRWRDEGGALRFHPLVEINARYTMAWWTGMGVRAQR